MHDRAPRNGPESMPTPPITVMATTSMLDCDRERWTRRLRQRVAVHGAADAGDEAGEQEALELHAARRHGERPGVVLVVAHGDEEPAEAARRTLRASSKSDEQRDQREVVVRLAGVERVPRMIGRPGSTPAPSAHDCCSTHAGITSAKPAWSP